MTAGAPLQRHAKIVPGEPVSLRLSASSIVGPFLACAAIATIGGYRYGWLVTWITLALAVVLWVLFVEGRIDLDQEGITFVPTLPLRPRQHVPFSALGPFAPKASRRRGSSVYPTVRADITDSRYVYRMAGLFGRRVVELTAIYSPARGEPSLSQSSLVQLLNDYRAASLNRLGALPPSEAGPAPTVAH